jgi:flagellar hook-associated protein 2
VSTLNSALNNLPELKKAFTNIDTTTPGNNGLAQNFVNFTQQALGVNGLVTTATSGLQAQLTSNGNQQSDLSNRISAYQTTLVAQYTALDTQIAQLNALSSYVTQQLASITGTKTN